LSHDQVALFKQPRSLLRLHTAQYIIARDIHLKIWFNRSIKTTQYGT